MANGNIGPVIARSARDEAIQSFFAALDCFAALAMTGERFRKYSGFTARIRCAFVQSNIATQSISMLTPFLCGVPPTQVRVTRSCSK
jgi:hypothetical protein